MLFAFSLLSALTTQAPPTPVPPEYRGSVHGDGSVSALMSDGRGLILGRGTEVLLIPTESIIQEELGVPVPSSVHGCDAFDHLIDIAPSIEIGATISALLHHKNGLIYVGAGDYGICYFDPLDMAAGVTWIELATRPSPDPGIETGGLWCFDLEDLSGGCGTTAVLGAMWGGWDCSEFRAYVGIETAASSSTTSPAIAHVKLTSTGTGANLPRPGTGYAIAQHGAYIYAAVGAAGLVRIQSGSASGGLVATAGPQFGLAFNGQGCVGCGGCSSSCTFPSAVFTGCKHDDPVLDGDHYWSRLRARDVRVEGGHLYVAAEGAGLLEFDLSFFEGQPSHWSSSNSTDAFSQVTQRMPDPLAAFAGTGRDDYGWDREQTCICERQHCFPFLLDTAEDPNTNEVTIAVATTPVVGLLTEWGHVRSHGGLTPLVHIPRLEVSDDDGLEKCYGKRAENIQMVDFVYEYGFFVFDAGLNQVLDMPVKGTNRTWRSLNLQPEYARDACTPFGSTPNEDREDFFYAFNATPEFIAFDLTQSTHLTWSSPHFSTFETTNCDSPSKYKQRAVNWGFGRFSKLEPSLVLGASDSTEPHALYRVDDSSGDLELVEIPNTLDNAYKFNLFCIDSWTDKTNCDPVVEWKADLTAFTSDDVGVLIGKLTHHGAGIAPAMEWWEFVLPDDPDQPSTLDELANGSLFGGMVINQHNEDLLCITRDRTPRGSVLFLTHEMEASTECGSSPGAGGADRESAVTLPLAGGKAPPVVAALFNEPTFDSIVGSPPDSPEARFMRCFPPRFFEIEETIPVTEPHGTTALAIPASFSAIPDPAYNGHPITTFYWLDSPDMNLGALSSTQPPCGSAVPCVRIASKHGSPTIGLELDLEDYAQATWYGSKRNDMLGYGDEATRVRALSVAIGSLGIDAQYAFVGDAAGVVHPIPLAGVFDYAMNAQDPNVLDHRNEPVTHVWQLPRNPIDNRADPISDVHFRTENGDHFLYLAANRTGVVKLKVELETDPSLGPVRFTWERTYNTPSQCGGLVIDTLEFDDPQNPGSTINKDVMIAFDHGDSGMVLFEL